MLNIARKLSQSEPCSFSVFEDDGGGDDVKLEYRHVEVQTEISCDHIALSTELSISVEKACNSSDSAEVVFWRAVSTQRARELDAIRDEIRKIEETTIENIRERRLLDQKHDALYEQLQRILGNSETNCADALAEDERGTS